MRRYLLLLLVFAATSALPAQPRVIVDSLLQKLPGTEGQERAHIYAELAIHYQFLPQGYDSTEYYANKLLDLSRTLDFQEGIERAYFYRGSVAWFRDQDYSKSLENFLILYDLLEERGENRRIHSVLNAIAQCYYNQGKIEKAMEAHQQALEGALAVRDYATAAMNLSNLGIIYSRLERTDKVLEVNKKALHYLRRDTSRDQTLATINTHLNIIDILIRTDQLPEAQSRLDTIEALTAEAQLFREKGRIDLARMRMFNKQEKWDALYELSKEVTERFEGAQGYDRIILGSARYHYGRSLASRGQNAEARAVIDQMLPLTEGAQIDKQRNIYQFVADIYEAMGEYEPALTYLKKYQELQDSMVRTENEERVLELQTVYEVADKERELAQNARERLQLRQRITLLVALVLLLLLIGGIAYYTIARTRQRERERINRIEQKMLSLQMNPHFIFNAISSIQNYLFDERDTSTAITHLSTFAALMRQMLENSRERFIPLEEELLFLDNYLKLQKLRFNDQFDYHILVDEDLEPDAVSVPPLLTQPFVENAIEHGKIYQVDDGRLDIRVARENGQLRIQIRDNGLGLEGKHHAPARETLVKKKSLSIAITRERLQLLSRLMKRTFTLDIRANGESTPGTTVSLHIPYASTN